MVAQNFPPVSSLIRSHLTMHAQLALSFSVGLLHHQGHDKSGQQTVQHAE